MKQPLYKLRIPEVIAELIRGMHPHLKKKIRTSLQKILDNPNSGKVLKDDLAGLWSFRVSKFRIIYKIPEGENIEIIAIGPRKKIYEETFRLISKLKETNERNKKSNGNKSSKV